MTVINSKFLKEAVHLMMLIRGIIFDIFKISSPFEFTQESKTFVNTKISYTLNM